MSLVKCSFSHEGKKCGHDFSEDGHTLCVRHRPCVSPEFVFDPVTCGVCEENVTFLRSVGSVNPLTQQFVSLKRSWAAVRRSAKRKHREPAWKDTELQVFVLGHGKSGASSRAPSSSSRSSPASSHHDGHSEPPALPTQEPAAPPSATPLLTAVDVSSLPIRDWIREIVMEVSTSLTPVPSVPVSGPPRAPPPTPPVAARNAPSSVQGTSGLASASPYAVNSSPVSDVGEDSVSSEDEAARPEADPLPGTWFPVPQEWNVMQEGDSWVVMRPGVAPDEFVKLPDHEVRWGVSHHSSTPAWHFKSLHAPAPPTAASSLPRPAFEDVQRALTTLALVVGLEPPVVSESDASHPCRSLGISWMEGLAVPFLKHLQEWWYTTASSTKSDPPARPTPRVQVPVLPTGPLWDSTVAEYLRSLPPRTFPPPLASPSKEELRASGRSRPASLESFSGFSSLLVLDILLQRMARQQDLPSLSPSVLAEYLLPILRNAVWQLASPVSGELGRSLLDDLTAWRRATAPLPPTARASLLHSDPCSPAFGSASAVSEALARAPQVAVVYKGQESSRPSSSKGKKHSSSSNRPFRAPASRSRQQRDVRHHPYSPRPSRSSSHQEYRDRPRHPAPPPSYRPQQRRPFRSTSWERKGGRR